MESGSIQGVPLRERLDDIPLLASHFLQRTCRKLNVAHVRLTQSDIGKLQAYHWPGNVRELENAIERAIIVAQNGRLALDLPQCSAAAVKQRPNAPPFARHPPDTSILTEEDRLRRDREMIRHALAQTAGKVFGPGGAQAGQISGRPPVSDETGQGRDLTGRAALSDHDSDPIPRGDGTREVSRLSPRRGW